MWMLLRHLLAILILPVTVTIIVPAWIAGRYAVKISPPANVIESVLLILGIGLVGIGLVLFFACIFRFASRGRGTLAPWDPPRNLVVDGPYRFVRNPMISGVALVLLGETALMRSVPHAIWAAAFMALNLTYIPLLEEPRLESRFGDDYRNYRDHVPRLLPRLRPWGGGDDSPEA